MGTALLILPEGKKPLQGKMIMNKKPENVKADAVPMQTPLLPTSRLGSATNVTRGQIVSVYGAKIADMFNPKGGYCFLGFRTSPKAQESDRLITGQVLGALKAGKLDTLPAAIHEGLYKTLNPTAENVTGIKLHPAAIAIMVMGRYPMGNSTKGFQEKKGKGCTLPADVVHYINDMVLPLIGMDKGYMPHNKVNAVNSLIDGLIDSSK